MSDYDNTNRGLLFRNEKRETDNHPHAKGSINVAGVEYWISAWTKTSQKGDKYQSLSVTPKEPQKDAPKPKAKPAGIDELDDDIPW